MKTMKMNRKEYLTKIYEARGEEALKMLTPEDKKKIACLDDADIWLFIEDPRSRICFIRNIGDL